jgi:hypothetical protein
MNNCEVSVSISNMQIVFIDPNVVEVPKSPVSVQTTVESMLVKPSSLPVAQKRRKSTESIQSLSKQTGEDDDRKVYMSPSQDGPVRWPQCPSDFK